MSVYADIIVNIASLDKSFQYLVPPDMEPQVEIGSAVRIPFGNGGRMREGYVIGLSEAPKVEPDRIKPVGELLTKKVRVETRLIRLAAWMRYTYGSTMQAALAAVLPVREKKQARSQVQDLLEEVPAEAEAALSEEQRAALASIEAEWENEGRPVLLQGVTGSGKTRIYLELTERVLQEGRQVIVLIPEIALSWQTVRRFRRRFGDRVTVMNSRMSKGERYEQFERMRRGEASVVIGPRSALFAPFADPGLKIGRAHV